MFQNSVQKKDPALSWKRGDRAFFASGACHILTHVFLLEFAGKGYRPYMIRPAVGFRGTHIIAATETTVFDYHGFSKKSAFLEHYFQKMKQFYPGWSATVFELHDFMTASFFAHYNHRAPDQYFSDPLPRARKFIQRKSRCVGVY